KQSQRYMEPPLRVSECQQNWVIARLACLCSVKSIYPGIEFLPPVTRRERGVVSDVVTAPHEGVDGAECLPFQLGKYKESVVKILGALARDSATYRVRHVKLRLSWQKVWGNLRHCAHISL